ncbi:uncharacterized protein EI97DRAFT_440251 [Westerdykella ornata]|uniref:Rhodanese domain-containing protein n=1 Tax=Westerdykella ornata TaxID=318751 RepID=A0A6A6JRH4_WESOR|nr:uncharacterized protein EI97DRAFT_440251 [Westerdykella ornata]KAF2278723.1 hypothetical protein EI97DRAFT_440251 [Westerdykella ornata]
MAPSTTPCPKGRCICRNKVVLRVGSEADHTALEICPKLPVTSQHLMNGIKAWKGDGRPVVEITWRIGADSPLSYHHWLYTRVIQTRTDREPQAPKNPGLDFCDIILAWMFGGTIKDEQYQDTAMSALIARLRAPFGEQAHFLRTINALYIKGVHNNLHETSPLRMLVADAVVWFGSPDLFERVKHDDGMPKSFVADLMDAMRRERDRLSAALKRIQTEHDFGSKKVRFAPSLPAEQEKQGGNGFAENEPAMLAELVNHKESIPTRRFEIRTAIPHRCRQQLPVPMFSSRPGRVLRWSISKSAYCYFRGNVIDYAQQGTSINSLNPMKSG